MQASKSPPLRCPPDPKLETLTAPMGGSSRVKAARPAAQVAEVTRSGRYKTFWRPPPGPTAFSILEEASFQVVQGSFLSQVFLSPSPTGSTLSLPSLPFFCPTGPSKTPVLDRKPLALSTSTTRAGRLDASHRELFSNGKQALLGPGFIPSTKNIAGSGFIHCFVHLSASSLFLFLFLYFFFVPCCLVRWRIRTPKRSDRISDALSRLRRAREAAAIHNLIPTTAWSDCSDSEGTRKNRTISSTQFLGSSTSLPAERFLSLSRSFRSHAHFPRPCRLCAAFGRFDFCPGCHRVILTISTL